MDGLSSPTTPASSLPPSTLPEAVRSQTPKRTRPTADALALDDVEPEAADAGDVGYSRRRPRARAHMNGDVPLVKDAVGESVLEAFETFLKTSVSSSTECMP